MSKIEFYEQYKFYLEKNDGTILSAPVLLEEINVMPDISGRYRTEIKLVSYGNTYWTTGKEFIAKEVEQTDNEWKCTWCGRPNHRKDEVCKSCGGTRSFLYAIRRMP